MRYFGQRNASLGAAAPKSRDEGPQHDLLRAFVDSAEVSEQPAYELATPVI
jgi:hypothetical protein